MMQLEMAKEYTCPDCGEKFPGLHLLYKFGDKLIYTCPKCGCVQEEDVVEQQLGIKEDK